MSDKQVPGCSKNSGRLRPRKPTDTTSTGRRVSKRSISSNLMSYSESSVDPITPPIAKATKDSKSVFKFSDKMNASVPLHNLHLCLFCDKNFPLVGLLQKHTDQVHRPSGRRGIKGGCIYCDKSEKDPITLFTHLATFHSSVYHGCLKCFIRFPNLSALDKHKCKSQERDHITTRNRTKNIKHEAKLDDNVAAPETGINNPHSHQKSPEVNIALSSDGSNSQKRKSTGDDNDAISNAEIYENIPLKQDSFSTISISSGTSLNSQKNKSLSGMSVIDTPAISFTYQKGSGGDGESHPENLTGKEELLNEYNAPYYQPFYSIIRQKTTSEDMDASKSIEPVNLTGRQKSLSVHSDASTFIIPFGSTSQNSSIGSIASTFIIPVGSTGKQENSSIDSNASTFIIPIESTGRQENSSNTNFIYGGTISETSSFSEPLYLSQRNSSPLNSSFNSGDISSPCHSPINLDYIETLSDIEEINSNAVPFPIPSTSGQNSSIGFNRVLIPSSSTSDSTPEMVSTSNIGNTTMLTEIHKGATRSMRFRAGNKDKTILSRLGIVQRIRSSMSDLSNSSDSFQFKTQPTTSLNYMTNFDPTFYLNVGNNIQKNLKYHLDGELEPKRNENKTVPVEMPSRIRVRDDLYDPEYVPTLLAPPQYTIDSMRSEPTVSFSRLRLWNPPPHTSSQPKLTHGNYSILDLHTQIQMREKYNEYGESQIDGNISCDSNERHEEMPLDLHDGTSAAVPRVFGLTSVRVEENVIQPLSFSGELSRPQNFACSMCGQSFDDARQFASHETAHQLPLPSRATAVDKKKNIRKKLRGALACTKCKTVPHLSQLHRHMLECAGDMIRRKIRRRPFGAKRRKIRGQTGVGSRLTLRRSTRAQLRARTRPKSQMRPRASPGDAESIQRMLADLPAKRRRQTVTIPETKIDGKIKPNKQQDVPILIQKPSGNDSLDSLHQVAGMTEVKRNTRKLKRHPENIGNHGETSGTLKKQAAHIVTRVLRTPKNIIGNTKNELSKQSETTQDNLPESTDRCLSNSLFIKSLLILNSKKEICPHSTKSSFSSQLPLKTKDNINAELNVEIDLSPNSNKVIADNLNQPAKLVKIRRGLNDCIAMLKDKLTGKSHPPESPLDLSERSINVNSSKKIVSVSGSRTSSQKPSQQKPVFDPTLRIPQFKVRSHIVASSILTTTVASTSAINASTCSPLTSSQEVIVNEESNQLSNNSNKKISTTISSYSTLLSKKNSYKKLALDSEGFRGLNVINGSFQEITSSENVVQNSTYNEQLSLLPKAIIEVVKKFIPCQNEELLKTLPVVLAKAVGELNFSNRTNESKINSDTVPRTSEIATQTNNDVICPPEFLDIDTDYFLIDPATGTISARDPTTCTISAQDPSISTTDSKTQEIIDLTIEDEVVPKLPSVQPTNPEAFLNVSINNIVHKNASDKRTTSLRAVRKKSSSLKNITSTCCYENRQMLYENKKSPQAELSSVAPQLSSLKVMPQSSSYIDGNNIVQVHENQILTSDVSKTDEALLLTIPNVIKSDETVCPTKISTTSKDASQQTQTLKTCSETNKIVKINILKNNVPEDCPVVEPLNILIAKEIKEPESFLLDLSVEPSNKRSNLLENSMNCDSILQKHNGSGTLVSDDCLLTNKIQTKNQAQVFNTNVSTDHLSEICKTTSQATMADQFMSVIDVHSKFDSELPSTKDIQFTTNHSESISKNIIEENLIVQNRKSNCAPSQKSFQKVGNEINDIKTPSHTDSCLIEHSTKNISAICGKKIITHKQDKLDILNSDQPESQVDDDEDDNIALSIMANKISKPSLKVISKDDVYNIASDIFKRDVRDKPMKCTKKQKFRCLKTLKTHKERETEVYIKQKLLSLKDKNILSKTEPILQKTAKEDLIKDNYINECQAMRKSFRLHKQSEDKITPPSLLDTDHGKQIEKKNSEVNSEIAEIKQPNSSISDITFDSTIGQEKKISKVDDIIQHNVEELNSDSDNIPEQRRLTRSTFNFVTGKSISNDEEFTSDNNDSAANDMTSNTKVHIIKKSSKKSEDFEMHNESSQHLMSTKLSENFKLSYVPELTSVKPSTEHDIESSDHNQPLSENSFQTSPDIKNTPTDIMESLKSVQSCNSNESIKLVEKSNGSKKIIISDNAFIDKTNSKHLQEKSIFKVTDKNSKKNTCTPLERKCKLQVTPSRKLSNTSHSIPHAQEILHNGLNVKPSQTKAFDKGNEKLNDEKNVLPVEYLEKSNLIRKVRKSSWKKHVLKDSLSDFNLSKSDNIALDSLNGCDQRNIFKQKKKLNLCTVTRSLIKNNSETKSSLRKILKSDIATNSTEEVQFTSDDFSNESSNQCSITSESPFTRIKSKRLVKNISDVSKKSEECEKNVNQTIKNNDPVKPINNLEITTEDIVGTTSFNKGIKLNHRTFLGNSFKKLKNRQKNSANTLNSSSKHEQTEGQKVHKYKKNYKMFNNFISRNRKIKKINNEKDLSLKFGTKGRNLRKRKNDDCYKTKSKQKMIGKRNTEMEESSDCSNNNISLNENLSTVNDVEESKNKSHSDNDTDLDNLDRDEMTISQLAILEKNKSKRSAYNRNIRSTKNIGNCQYIISSPKIETKSFVQSKRQKKNSTVQIDKATDENKATKFSPSNCSLKRVSKSQKSVQFVETSGAKGDMKLLTNEDDISFKSLQNQNDISNYQEDNKSLENHIVKSDDICCTISNPKSRSQSNNSTDPPQCFRNNYHSEEVKVCSENNIEVTCTGDIPKISGSTFINIKRRRRSIKKSIPEDSCKTPVLQESVKVQNDLDVNLQFENDNINLEQHFSLSMEKSKGEKEIINCCFSDISADLRLSNENPNKTTEKKIKHCNIDSVSIRRSNTDNSFENKSDALVDLKIRKTKKITKIVKEEFIRPTLTQSEENTNTINNNVDVENSSVLSKLFPKITNLSKKHGNNPVKLPISVVELKEAKEVQRKKSIENISKTLEADSVIRDTYLENFGIYSERRPRRSNLLASKKISETFHLDSSDTEDVNSINDSTEETVTPIKEKANDNIIQNRLLNENENIKMHEINNKIESSYENKNIVRTPISTKDNGSETYCAICRRKFRRPDNLMKHKMTLTHISKLSELEALEMEEKKKVEQNCVERPQLLSQNTSELLYDLEKNKYPLNEITTTTDDRSQSELQENLSENHVENVYPIAESEIEVIFQNEGPRKKLSNDEKLFFECCSLLKESRKSCAPSNSDAVLNISDNNDANVMDIINSKETLDINISNTNIQIPLVCDEDPSPVTEFYSEYPLANSPVAALDDSISKQSLVNYANINEDLKAVDCDKRSEIFKTLPFDLLEDKFDKIKRKSRTQAAAAKVEMITNQTQQSASKRIRKDVAKRTKVTGKKHKKTQDTRLNIPTKGALKVFDGIKVSIPTAEIKLPENIHNEHTERDEKIVFDDVVKWDTNTNSQTNSKADFKKRLDVYEFLDDEEINEVSFNLPLHDRNLSSKASGNINVEKQVQKVIENDPCDVISQISGPSGSDMDDFVYMSDDYLVNPSEEDGSSVSGDRMSVKSRTLSKAFLPGHKRDATEKNAIMGKIFKGNAVRHERKNVLLKDKKTCLEATTDMDELFNSLLDSTQASPIAKSTIHKSNDQEAEAENTKDTLSCELDFSDAQQYTEDSLEAGVARRRTKRKCAAGKQNVLVESWSSESEAERWGSGTSGHLDGVRRRAIKRTSFRRSSSRSEASGATMTVRTHLEQHGWIVGDSHKKLVTMLAHAKGRKREDKHNNKL